MKKLNILLLIMITTFMSITYVDAKETVTCNFYTPTIDELISSVGYDYIYDLSLELYNESKSLYPNANYYSLFISYTNDYYYSFNFIYYSELPTFEYRDVKYSGNVSSPFGNSYDRKISLNYDSTSEIGKKSYYFTLNNGSLNIQTITPYSFDSEFFVAYFTNSNEFSWCKISPPFMSNIYPTFIMPPNKYYDFTLDLGEFILQDSINSTSYSALSEDSDYYKFYPYTYYYSGDLDNYTNVNLDNYEYVILNLKDYNKKDAFNTNLKVKGMVGITPIYEFGTIEKQEITDRCNINYDDYTDYRLYVLKEDLINNAIYIVKPCKEGSSFKYDSSIFDITFVTNDNVNDPVITVGGVEYHTIPFDKLSNSANKNEEENFIPGESEGFHPIESLTDYISSFWHSLTTFMSLVTKFFNTLPIEIRAVTITFFTTACTLGLLKILKR